MSNTKISITAEFVSLIKSNSNEKYNYFVSDRTRNLYKLVSGIFSKSTIKNIFKNRLLLSREFDEFIESGDFNTIVEFGCGYSLRGFEHSLKNKEVVYIDTDFTEVIENKKLILTNICKDYKITFPSNYVLLPIDVLKDKIVSTLEKYLGDKNLFIAEGLTPYFSFEEYSGFINQIKPLLNNKQGIFFSQENFLKKQSFAYKILRKFVSLVTKNKSNIKFKTKDDLIRFLKQAGFENCDAYYKDENMFYKLN